MSTSKLPGAILIILTSIAGTSICSCFFPTRWQGRWRMDDNTVVVITTNEISNKGVCYEQLKDAYLMENRFQQCHQCVMIIDRHYNVIQFRESACIGKESLQSVCSQMRVEPSYITLVRENSHPVPCPTSSNYHFVFTNDSQCFCRSPISYIHKCSSPSSYRFLFKRCKNCIGTNDRELQLTCLAKWTDGYHNYALAYDLSTIIIDSSTPLSIVCFAYRTYDSIVYMDISDNCQGFFHSPKIGTSLSLELTEDNYGWPKAECAFPDWLRLSDEPWHDNLNTFTLSFNHPLFDSFDLLFDESSIVSQRQQQQLQEDSSMEMKDTPLKDDFKIFQLQQSITTTTTTFISSVNNETTATTTTIVDNEMSLKGERSKVRRKRQVQGQHSLARFYPQVQSTYKCVSNDNRTYKVHSLDGCLTRYKCIKFEKHKIPQIAWLSIVVLDNQHEGCQDDSFKSSKVERHLLVSDDLKKETNGCPFSGVYGSHPADGKESTCRTELTSGCHGRPKSELLLVSSCQREPVLRMECRMWWGDDLSNVVLVKMLSQETDGAYTFDCWSIKPRDKTLEFVNEPTCLPSQPHHIRKKVYKFLYKLSQCPMNDQVSFNASPRQSFAGNENKTSNSKLLNDIQRQQQQTHPSRRPTNLTMGRTKPKSPVNLSLVSSIDESRGNDSSRQRSSSQEQLEEDRHKRAEEKRSQTSNDSHKLIENKFSSSNGVVKPMFRFKPLHKRLPSSAVVAQYFKPIQLVSFLLFSPYYRPRFLEGV